MKNIFRTLLGAALLSSTVAYADATPRNVTLEQVENFLSSAGLQSCRVEKIDPKKSTWSSTRLSAWIELAPDCSKADPNNPDVGHFHQFNSKFERDAMISRFRSSLPRGINLQAGIWPVGDFGAIALIGPHMNQYKALIQAEFTKRLAEERKKTSGN